MPALRATQSNAPPPVRQAPLAPETPARPVGSVTVKSAANIRNAPSPTATILRPASAGEKFGVFGRSSGWVQVGTDKPFGWIAASLLIE
jgi:hypothetical protein